MANLKTLANRLASIANELPVATSNLSSEIAEAIITRLIYDTPVDTSKALSNWQVVLGDGLPHSIPALVQGSKGSSEEASQAEAISRARIILKGKRPGQDIHIVNVLPYIRRLNDGYSSQSPAGFVEKAQLIGRKLAEEKGLKLNVR